MEWLWGRARILGHLLSLLVPFLIIDSFLVPPPDSFAVLTVSVYPAITALNSVHAITKARFLYLCDALLIGS